jgi:hypothetical protein
VERASAASATMAETQPLQPTSGIHKGLGLGLRLRALRWAFLICTVSGKHCSSSCGALSDTAATVAAVGLCDAASCSRVRTLSFKARACSSAWTRSFMAARARSRVRTLPSKDTKFVQLMLMVSPVRSGGSTQ